MSSLKNTSYIFIPFIFKKQADFNPLIESFNNSDSWEQIHYEIVYMLKYVADKIDSHNKETCQCFHYKLKDSYRDKFGLASENDWFSTTTYSFREQDENALFKILSVQLYCFSTTVGIIAFQIHLEKDDPFWVSNAQYHLKKVSREKIFLVNSTKSTTMLDISKELASEFSQISEITFFYYANPSTERANVLTYLEVEPQDSYKKELFYLRRCYSDGFIYIENSKLDEDEIFIPSKDTVWGISPEAAVCLVCPGYGRAKFLQGTFYKNFNAQYLFMYVLLLHQKYVLYMFLTKIGIGTYNNLDTLEEYRHALYEFETDFVFSCVTEVPQYQNLYDRMTEAFSLKKMYEDVHEPLISLSEVRREAAENEQKKRDDNVNKALLMLSVLSFFSALVDSFDFVDSFFGWFLGDVGVRIVQVCCIIGIVVTVFLAFKNLLDSRKLRRCHRNK